MDDAEAYAELLSSHKTMARVRRAARRALYGDERNPVKYGFGPEPVIVLEQTASNLRTVVLDEASVPTEKRGAALTELAKVETAHPIEMKAAPRVERIGRG
jgi:hypothetical protein